VAQSFDRKGQPAKVVKVWSLEIMFVEVRSLEIMLSESVNRWNESTLVTGIDVT
jgi:hypothetical protein